MLLETSVPGIFAVGDVRHRSVKRVASAVGEGSVAITLVHEYPAPCRADSVDQRRAFARSTFGEVAAIAHVDRLEAEPARERHSLGRAGAPRGP